MVRATMSSSGPREPATRSRNQPLTASRMRAAMSGKPGPLPNGNGRVSRSRSRIPLLPDRELLGGLVVGGGSGPSVLGGLVGLGAGWAAWAGEPASSTLDSTTRTAAAMLRVPCPCRRSAIGSHPDDLLEQGDQPG